MLTYDEQEIKVGQVLRGDNRYRRVLVVGKDTMGNDSVLLTPSCGSIKDALNTCCVGANWNQGEIDSHKFTLACRRPLGVFDSNGDEWHEDDVTENGRKVFDAVKSRNGDGKDYILVENSAADGGWGILISKHRTIHNSSPSACIEVGKKVNVKINGVECEATITGVKKEGEEK